MKYLWRFKHVLFSKKIFNNRITPYISNAVINFKNQDQTWFRAFSVSRSYFYCVNESVKIKKKPPFSSVYQTTLIDFLRDNKLYYTCDQQVSDDFIKEITQKPLAELSNNELINLISSAIKTKQLSPDLCKEIDDECLRRFDDFSIPELLRLIDAWLYRIPHILNNLQFYRLCVSRFDKILQNKKINPPLFVQMYFYVSLMKNKGLAAKTIKAALDNLLSNYSNVRTLNVDEITIIAVSTFRTSTTIRSRVFLQLISNCIKSNFSTIVKNEAQLVSLIKPLRPADYNDPSLLELIAENFALLESANVITKIHIFALFAQSLYHDEEFLLKFADSVALNLKEMLEQKDYVTIRIKDLSRFLWTLSYLGIKPTVSNFDLEVIEKTNDWIDGNYFDGTNLHQLVSMMCSMLVLNWNYESLFRKIFDAYTLDQLKGENNIKNMMNMNLILSALSIEAPHLINEEMLKFIDPCAVPTVKKHLLTRKILKDAFNTVWILKNNLNLTDINCHFNIPHLFILGITFYSPNRNLINIEVLDTTNSLSNTNIPHGLMKLKLQLLEQKKVNLFIINSLSVPEDNNFLYIIENKIREIDEK